MLKFLRLETLSVFQSGPVFMVEVASNTIIIKLIVPTVPRDDAKKQHLINALTKMGCEGSSSAPLKPKERGYSWKFTKPRFK